MKRAIKHTLLFVVLALLSGCLNDNTLDNTPPYHSNEVRLWADVGYSPNLSYSSQSVTRGNANSTSGIIDPATDTVMMLGMARIDEMHTPSYPNFLNCDEPILAEMGEPNAANSYIRDITFTSSAQFFYNTTDYVKYVAWHPWLPNEDGYEYNSNGEATTVKIPITGDSDIMYGNVVTGSQIDGFEVMEFDHALCVYRIYIYSMQEEDGTQSASWGALEDMNIEDLPTSCTLTLPKDDTEKFSVAYEGRATLELSDPNNNIFFDAGDKIPVGLANRRMVAKCVAAPPADGMLNISLSTSMAEARQRVSIARNFKAGYAYDIVLRFSNHGFINADVSVSEWKRYDEVIKQEVDVEMFYNLSNYETANSYIVNSANYGYCFDGTIKGNGDSSLVGGESTSLNPKYIDILWDDTPMITINGVQRKALTLDLHELSQGRVLFHVQGDLNNDMDKRLLSEGNVIIAAYDEEGGDILWTWHIWLTDRVKAQGYPNGYIVQDRNLGAVSSEPDGENGMDGLYYQWGRPTPFKPASSGVYGAVSRVPSNPSQVATVGEAIANPTTLYGSGDAARHDWLATQNNALWGYQNEHTDLEKTIYDPCPPGYMVADIRVWQNIARYEVTGGWHSGVGVNVSVASNSVWYPFQGSIESDGTENIYRDVSRLWSSVIDLRTTNEPYELQYTARGAASWNSNGSHRNRALPVRCVSAHSTAIVTDLSASQTANCYMVHRAGYYKFKATVRGNGVGSLLPLGGTTTAEINGGLSTTIAPAKVDLLWWQGDFTEVTGSEADIENLIPLQLLNNGELDEEGYVTFYVGNYHEGNVGLAAYDVDGEILWSWHLWFTDKPTDLITGNYTLMDRFLGATTVPNTSGSSISFADEKERMATYGFYYQWGRKDPIMGAPSYRAGTETVSGKPQSSQYWVKNYMTGEWSSRTDIDTADAATIPVVIQNPMTFYKSTSLCGNTTCGWFPASFADGYTNVALWGYAVKDYSIQGQTFSKTMHDPCPPGYRTPFHHAWGYVINGTHYGYTYEENGGNINFSNGEASFDNYGIVFNKSYFDRAWYPFVGYRYPTTGGYREVGANGWMLTGMPMGQYNTRTYVYTDTYSGQVTQQGTNGGYGAAYAMPARCQKD
ncbi:MAG: hypothetical protein E7141_05950 [Rikenellaceae bacterium]|nr:hypothetical protein [Rikenellaceae bacterium]